MMVPAGMRNWPLRTTGAMTSASTGSLAFDAVVETLVLRRTCSSVPAGTSRPAAKTMPANNNVAHALLRAASALLPMHGPCVETSLDAARMSVCATGKKLLLNFDQFRNRAIDVFNPHCQAFARVELLLGNFKTRRDHAVFRP